MDLQAIFTKLSPKRSDQLLVGIENSDDAGVFQITEDVAIVQTADFITPIVDDPFLYGQVAAANSLSDVYAMGGQAISVLNLCCFPGKGVDIDTLAKILQGGLDKTEEAGALLVGGHTVRDDEMKYGLSVNGVVHPKKVTPNSGAKPGDKLILTKPIGTGVHISGGRKGVLASEKLNAACHVMATLNKTAAEVMVEFEAKGCTDITGFGLGGHGLEMAKGSKVGLRFFFGQIPLFADTMDLIQKGVMTGVTATNAQLIQKHVKFNDLESTEQAVFHDPQTSGGLLIAIRSQEADALLARLKERGVEYAQIVGEVFETDTPGLDVVR